MVCNLLFSLYTLHPTEQNIIHFLVSNMKTFISRMPHAILLGMLSPPLSSPSVSTPSNQPGTPSIPSTPSPLKESPSQGPVASQTSPARRGPQSPHVLMPLPCKKGEVLQYNNFKCPECQTQFAGKAELVAHFQQIRATPNSVSSTFFVFISNC